MAVNMPTYADFVARFPSFSEREEAYITALLAEVEPQISESLPTAEQKTAALYLAAHMVVMEDDVQGNPVTSETLGPLSTSYAVPTNQKWMERTEYGRRYWNIVSRYGLTTAGGILVVGGVGCA